MLICTAVTMEVQVHFIFVPALDVANSRDPCILRSHFLSK